MTRHLWLLLLSSHLTVGLLSYRAASYSGEERDSDGGRDTGLPAMLLTGARQRSGVISVSIPVGDSSASASAALASQGLRQRIGVLAREAETMDARQVLRALKAIRFQPNGPERGMAQQVLLARYGEVDPETALSYVDSLTGEDFETGGLTVMSAWTAVDPEGAAAYYLENQDDFGVFDDQQRILAGTVAAEWSRNDPNAALAWTADLPPDVRGEAYGRIVAELVTQNPAEALEVVQSMAPGYERVEMLETLVDQWAHVDADAAASFLVRETAGEEQLRATTSLMNAWMTKDPMAASDWLNRQEEGTLKDVAIVALTQARVVARDPEAAAAWTSVIQDDSLRTAVQEGLRLP